MNEAFAKFKKDNMYKRYLDGLNTSPSSVTFDIGSYKGDSLLKLRSKVQGTIHGFEPIVTFGLACRERIKDFPYTYVHPIGIGDADEYKLLFVAEDNTSEFIAFQNSEQCVFRSFFNVWNHLKIDTLDVLHMNIEGGEYAVFKSILQYGLLPKIKSIIVQFHYPERYAAERKKIQTELQKTHTCVYDYAFVWERWDLKQE